MIALTILQDSLDNSNIDHDYVPSMCEGDSDLDFDFDPDPFDVDKHQNVYSDVSIILRSLTAIYIFHTCFVLS